MDSQIKKKCAPGRPYILNEEDFLDIINSQAFFCRKVDLQESKKLLDLIDQNRNAKIDFYHCNRIFDE